MGISLYLTPVRWATYPGTISRSYGAGAAGRAPRGHRGFDLNC